MLDALDALQSWIDKIQQDELDVAGTRTREPDGFMTIYDDNGRIFTGKVWRDEQSSINAQAIHSGFMKPQFRVRVYLR